MTLPSAEAERYSRQLPLPGWSPEAQDRLAGASAIVVGAGALGSPAAAYLAAAGLGRIGIVDSEPVELSSLSRQALHFTREVGSNKAEGIVLKLGALNPEIAAEPYPVRLEATNAVAIVAGADLVLDCSNDPATQAMVNDAVCAEQVPLVTGAVEALRGTLMATLPGRSACWRCAVAALGAEPSGDGAGPTLGAMAGMVGSAQALEGLKLLTAVGSPVLDRVLRLDGREADPRPIAVPRVAGCPGCARVGGPRQSV